MFDVGDTLLFYGFESGAGPLLDSAGNAITVNSVNLGGGKMLYYAVRKLTAADFATANGEFRWQNPTTKALIGWQAYKGISAITFKTKRDYQYNSPSDTVVIPGFSKSTDHKGVVVLGRTDTNNVLGTPPNTKWRNRISETVNPFSPEGKGFVFDNGLGKSTYVDGSNIVFSGYRYISGYGYYYEPLYDYRTIGLAAFELT
jgi:hypothetical protein